MVDMNNNAIYVEQFYICAKKAADLRMGFTFIPQEISKQMRG